MTDKLSIEQRTLPMIQQVLTKEVGAGALFSTGRDYRFALWRIWRKDLPLLMLIGLNPSTANADKNDPTITRLSGIPGKLGLVARNGYGGFYMTNLYPLVTPYPSELSMSRDYMTHNNDVLFRVRELCGAVVFCWGNFETYGRDREVFEMFADPLCFGVNKSGSPKHPLYLSGRTTLTEYKPQLTHSMINKINISLTPEQLNIL